MERKRKNGINLTDGKRNIINALINEYDIKTAEDIQDALKDLLGGTIQVCIASLISKKMKFFFLRNPL